MAKAQSILSADISGEPSMAGVVLAEMIKRADPESPNRLVLMMSAKSRHNTWPINDARNYHQLKRAAVFLPCADTMEPLVRQSADHSQDQHAIGLFVFCDNSALIANTTHFDDGRQNHGLKAMTVLPRVYRVAHTAPRCKGDIPELKEGRQRQIKVMTSVTGINWGRLRIGGVDVTWSKKLARPHHPDAEQTGGLWFQQDCGVALHARVLLARLYAEMLAILAADSAAPMPIKPSSGGRPGRDWPLGLTWTTWAPEEATLIKARLTTIVTILTEDCQYDRQGLRATLIAGKPCNPAKPADGAFTRPRIEIWTPGDWPGPSRMDLTIKAETMFFQGSWERNFFLGQNFDWASRRAGSPSAAPGPVSSAHIASSIWSPVSRHQSMEMHRSLIHDPCPIPRERVVRIMAATPTRDQ